MAQLLLILLFVFIDRTIGSINITLVSSTITTSTLTSNSALSSCSYCQSNMCRCSADNQILNCSLYLLNLTWTSTCTEMREWTIVDFSSRNFDAFDATKLLSLRMQRLFLRSNSLSNIAEGSFDSIGDILVELDLQINQLSTLSSTWLNAKLSQLKILNLAVNQLKSLTELDDIELPSLRELNISWNQLEVFPDQIRQWKSLTTLDLSFNRLTSLPRFALLGLDALTWLSLASNRYLNCLLQDAFKYLKSLKYLDVSSTNLIDLDGCIFVPLTSLQTLKIELIVLNCSSCWLPIAKQNSIDLHGQCVYNRSLVRLNSLTNEQLSSACTKTSIDCSSNECPDNTIDFTSRLLQSDDRSDPLENAQQKRNRTIEIILAVVFSIIAVLALALAIVLIYRYKRGKQIFCCDCFSRSSNTMKETHHARQHHQRAINNNPTIIESIVTHGANMNMPSYSNQNHAFVEENTVNAKRKLYNPMFMDSPTVNTKEEQPTRIISNDTTSPPHPLYSGDL